MQITSSDLETEPEVKSQIQITNSDLENGEKFHMLTRINIEATRKENPDD